MLIKYIKCRHLRVVVCLFHVQDTHWLQVNVALTGLDMMPDYLTVRLLTKFLIGNFLLLLIQPSENVDLHNFIVSSRDLPFSVIVGPVTGFSSEHIDVNHLYSNLSCCQNVRISGVSPSGLKEFYCIFLLFVYFNENVFCIGLCCQHVFISLCATCGYYKCNQVLKGKQLYEPFYRN